MEDTPFPPPVELLVARADEAFQAQRPAEARRLLARARELLPGDSRLWVIEGNLAFLMGDPELAERLFQAALDGDPGSLEAAVALGTAARALGRDAAAADTLAAALGRAPPDLGRWAGEVEALAGQLAGAGYPEPRRLLRARLPHAACAPGSTPPPPAPEHPRPQRSLIVYGNCQSQAISHLAAGMPEVTDRYRVVQFTSFGGAPAPSPQELASCAILWEQSGQRVQFPLRNALPPDAVTVRWAPADFMSLWPLHWADPLIRPMPPDYPWGRYPDGNRLVNELTDRDAGGDLLAAYRATDLLAFTDFDRFHELTTLRLRAADARCDVKIGAWILDGFRRHRLHWAGVHPTGRLLRELFVRLLEATPRALLGAPQERAATLARVEALVRLETLSANRPPIERCVAERLGIQWSIDGPLYGCRAVDRLTADEYTAGHLAWRRDEVRRARAEAGRAPPGLGGTA